MEIDAENDIQDEAKEDEEEAEGAADIDPRDGSGDFDGDFDGEGDAVVLDDGDGVVQFDVTEFLHIDGVGPEDRITTEDEGMPAVDVDAVVAMVGSDVQAVASVGGGHDHVLGAAATQEERQD